MGDPCRILAKPGLSGPKSCREEGSEELDFSSVRGLLVSCPCLFCMLSARDHLHDDFVVRPQRTEGTILKPVGLEVSLQMSLSAQLLCLALMVRCL